MKPTVMVLGATGFIGAHVARALRSRGYSVHGTRRPTSETWHVDDVEIEWHAVDLDGAPEALEPHLDACDAIVDCAGFAPRSGIDVDGALAHGVGRLRGVLEAGRRSRIERVVYVSSPATLGTEPGEGGRLTESDYYTPGRVGDAYYEAKFSMEAEIYRYLPNGPPVVIAIPTAVFGPGDIKPSTGEFLVRLARGRLPALIEGRFNAVDVRDVAETLVGTLKQGRPGRRYVLGGHDVDISEFAAKAASHSGTEAPERRLPARAVRSIARLLEGVVRRFGYDGPSPLIGVDMMAFARPASSERAENELGHTVRPLDSTLRDAYEWFGAHGYL